ncbi:MAG: hypothetical protein ABIN91_15155 [Mucilaginibacter sp.]|uniref:hypothetical protein n=1 Tax=Mucilaginibacter sp. TaxID=1882438 RepID=UPI003263C21A
MDTSKEPLFNSTGNITKENLIALYGPLLSGELVLRFAEHKNFDAARIEFQTWDERSVVEMGNLLGQDYRTQTVVYKTKDEYIAALFLKALINEWEDNRLEKIRVRLEDPVQQKLAADLLKIRLSGKLPHIDLAGTDFTIDWRLRQLRETAEPWKNISFKEMEMAESGEEYLIFFDTENQNIYIPDDDITELPENIVGLEIPYELKLDPIAVARDCGMEEIFLLAEHPIQETLSAKVIPLSETGLPEFIANNNRNNSRVPGHGVGDNNNQSPRRGR